MLSLSLQDIIEIHAMAKHERMSEISAASLGQADEAEDLQQVLAEFRDTHCSLEQGFENTPE
jgi:hypothetical protein